MRRFHFIAALGGFLGLASAVNAAPIPSFRPTTTFRAPSFTPARAPVFSPARVPVYHPPAVGHSVMPHVPVGSSRQPLFHTNPSRVHALPAATTTLLRQLKGGYLSNRMTASTMKNVPTTNRAAQTALASSTTPSSRSGARAIGSQAASSLDPSQIADAVQQTASSLSGGSGQGGSSGQEGSAIENDQPSIASRAESGTVASGDETATEWGMRVVELYSGAAAKADLRAGDIILGVGGKRTQTFEELTTALAQANGPVEFLFINGDNNKIEKMLVTPVDGKIGISTDPVEIE